MIYNFKGASVRLEDRLLIFSSITRGVAFQKSRFDIFDENDILIRADRCTENYFENKNIHYFSNFDHVELQISIKTNFFNIPICPYIFKNSNINFVQFIGLQSNFLFPSRIPFYDISLTNKTINLIANINHYHLRKAEKHSEPILCFNI